jgi:uncharacterized protein
MSELLVNERKRKDLLKHMIVQLHEGHAPEAIRSQLIRVLGQVPYNEVVEVEQELINERFPASEILKLCDIHTAALRGQIDHKDAKTAPPGHPVHTFKEENRALLWEVQSLEKLYDAVRKLESREDPSDLVEQIRIRFNALTDVEKHYQRKENLLFPFLEKHGITGPPTVMWGKHDETRELLKASIEVLEAAAGASAEELALVVETVLKPASDSVEEMIYKEDQILLPMSLDTLTEGEWYAVYRQSPEIGFCLYDPADEWIASVELAEEAPTAERIQLPSGNLTVTELNAILNSIPFDLTFVDSNDRVRYFTQGRERIFARNRAIIGRKVQLCHPPNSVHIVQQILEDFRSGKESRAPFWIEMKGRFIHIEYFALRDNEGNYLGTLEVSQDLTEKRQLTGEQRLLSYAKDEKNEAS